MRAAGVEFLDTPDTYFDVIDAAHPEPRRGRGAPAQEQDPDRRRPGDQAAQAAADLHQPTRSARSSSRSSSARATKASARAISRRCSRASSATRCARRAVTSDAIRTGRWRSRARLPVRLRQRVRHRRRICRGTLPRGAQFAAAGGAWPVRRAGLRARAFTAPRHQNRRSWLYRIRPAAMHGAFAPFDAAALPQPLRRGAGHAEPVALESAAAARRRRPTSSTACSPWPATARRASQSGIGIHVYAANRSMADRCFYDADGELLIVPQQGRLRIAHRTRRARGRAAARSR